MSVCISLFGLRRVLFMSVLVYVVCSLRSLIAASCLRCALFRSCVRSFPSLGISLCLPIVMSAFLPSVISFFRYVFSSSVLTFCISFNRYLCMHVFRDVLLCCFVSVYMSVLSVISSVWLYVVSYVCPYLVRAHFCMFFFLSVVHSLCRYVFR